MLSRSLLPRRSLAWSAKRSPAVVGLGESGPLDHGAHGAVEHEDALGEEASQRLGGVGAQVVVGHSGLRLCGIGDLSV